LKKALIITITNIITITIILMK